MSQDRAGGGQILKWMLVMIFIAGLLTEFLIVVPLKIIKWKSVDKNMREPLFKSISPMGNDFISMIGIANYFVYGMFWLLTFVLIANVVQPNFHFNSLYTEQYITIHNDITRKFSGDTLFIWSMIVSCALIFLGWSIYIAYCDIFETRYEKEYYEMSEDEKTELKIKNEVNRRIREIEDKKQIEINTKELELIKIEDLPF